MSWLFSRTDEAEIAEKMIEYKQARKDLEAASLENNKALRRILEEVAMGPKRN